MKNRNFIHSKENEIYYANCDFKTEDLQNAGATFLTLVENQIVELLDSQDPNNYLIRTKNSLGESSTIGWIPACFLRPNSHRDDVTKI